MIFVNSPIGIPQSKLNDTSFKWHHHNGVIWFSPCQWDEVDIVATKGGGDGNLRGYKNPGKWSNEDQLSGGRMDFVGMVGKNSVGLIKTHDTMALFDSSPACSR
ncbi:MAG: hypothetical protein KJ589_15910 [Proteobacteria bacterium]|nr:hypothetical protein [Pseudomonadota bacterium]